jgi:protease IV
MINIRTILLILMVLFVSFYLKDMTTDHAAVIKVEGILTPQQDQATKFINSFDIAVQNNAVKLIIIKINSEGGDGVQAERIYRRIKRDNLDIPIIAVVDRCALSAGYLVASATDNIYVNHNSLVGHLGVVFHMSEDMKEDKEIDTSGILFAGKYKVSR